MPWVYNESDIAAIQNQKLEFENRLNELHDYQAGLKTELQELEQAEALLQVISKEYAEKLANGDIAAADMLENNRKSQMQDNDTKKQGIVHKMAGIKEAENLIKADIAIYAEMEGYVRKLFELKQYNRLKVQFCNAFSHLEEISNEINPIARKLWGDKYQQWEHLNMIQLLINKVKNYDFGHLE